MSEAKRPEGPFDWETEPTLPKPKKKKRTEEEPEPVAAEGEEADNAEEPAEPPKPTEAERRVARAEQEFKQRVELAEVRSRLPAAVYQRIEAALQAAGGAWHLEKGKYVFTRLVKQDTIPVKQPVVAEHRFGFFRDSESPHQPAELNRKLEQVFHNPDDRVKEDLQELTEHLAPADEIVVRWQPPDTSEPVVYKLSATEVIEIRPEPTVSVIPAPAEIGQREEQIVELEVPDQAVEMPLKEVEIPADEEVTPAVADQAVVTELARVLERPPEPAKEPGKVPVVEPAEVTQVVEQVWGEDEPELSVEAEPVEATAEEPVESYGLPEVLADLETYGVCLNDLPPMEGGAAVPAPRRHKRSEPPSEYEAPEPRGNQGPTIRSSRGAERQIYILESGWRQPEHHPDLRFKLKARKLLRILARRYGLRLTPELEAYLLEIVMRPKQIGGRKVFGLGLHRDELLQILAAIWLNFGDKYAIRPNI